ncbi:hypothetical protein Avbf_00259 [Armadillidium vulgare]|nr:hypothetical protein Avbf_00259 [Armadillidium vulgare]
MEYSTNEVRILELVLHSKAITLP